jgi:transposase-like protein
MPPVDRNRPKRARSSESGYSLMEFSREFPDDATCLQWLWVNRHSPDGEHAYCQRCAMERRFKRYNGARQRQVWKCTSCTQEISPTAGTIFHKSSTSLHLWFYAMWLMTSTRCGISAKQLERELGVTYKTAWRMFRLIRYELMGDEDAAPLSGAVEVDETQIAGKIRNKQRRERDALGIHKRAWAYQNAVKVFAAVERGGFVRASVIPDSGRKTLEGKVRETVEPGSTLYADEWIAYNWLGDEYTLRRIRHRDREYVVGDIHTQTVEGFFALLKNAIRGVHHGVSEQWLQGYVNEYAWRYNHRGNRNAMFRKLLLRATAS